MNNQIGRDQRDYIRFRESDSSDDKSKDSIGRLSGLNRFGEERIRHDSYQDDHFRNDYEPTYKDEYGRKHPYEHGGESNRWSDDIRSESSHEGHRGKGPKGYERSPGRIRDEACEKLSADDGLDASGIEVEIEDRCIILKGEVSSRRDKKIAERIVENIAGIEDVHNLLRIPGIGNI